LAVDPYTTLGVKKHATQEEIQKAYRRLAKKLHPDLNPGNKIAEDKFKEVSAAYDLLGDPEKRTRFDRGEIDAEGKPRFRGFEGFGGNAGARPGGGFGAGGPDAEFETFTFGPEGFTRGARRGRAGAGAGGGGFGGFEDILRDAFAGAGARRGGGAGFEAEDLGGGTGANVTATLTVSLLDAAQGATQRVRLPNGKDVEVKIPAGIANGQQIRLRGQGAAGASAPGDLLITVSIAPHPTFTLDGADIRLDLPVTLYEAALGAKVRVPTLDRPVELTIPAGTNGGRTFRLKGKGYPAKEGRGDLFATVRLMLPEQTDAEFEALMKKWRSDKPYDPRKDM